MESYEDSYTRLFKLIQAGAATEDRLPPEEVLAGQMGISRVKLRDILAELETKGYITRKKGVGTKINHHIFKEKGRLDIDNIYSEVIEESGFKSTVFVRKITTMTDVPELVREKLSLEPDEKAIRIEKLVHADDIPVILISDYVTSKYFNDVDLDVSLIAMSTFCFVQRYCDEILDNIIVHFDACAVDEDISGTMKLPVGTPIMKLDSVCYSIDLKPIMFSIEYFNTKIIPFSFHKKVLRSKFFRS